MSWNVVLTKTTPHACVRRPMKTITDTEVVFWVREGRNVGFSARSILMHSTHQPSPPPLFLNLTHWLNSLTYCLCNIHRGTHGGFYVWPCYSWPRLPFLLLSSQTLTSRCFPVNGVFGCTDYLNIHNELGVIHCVLTACRKAPGPSHALESNSITIHYFLDHVYKYFTILHWLRLHSTDRHHVYQSCECLTRLILSLLSAK